MPIASCCPDTRTLGDFLIGNVPDDQAETLERHLAQCARCLKLVRTLRPSDAFVDAVRAGLGTEMPGSEVDEALVGRLCRLIDDNSVPASDLRPENADSFLEPPQRPGELGRFGLYRVVQRLGRGGMGVVYLARQERPARLVALKVLAGVPPADSQRLARFRAETDVITALRHPNVVHVYEAGEHAGLPYYTMEYLEAGNLAHRLAVSPLPAREAAALVKTLCEAIQVAHELHIVHRDLKPSNILLGADGTPKIGDFGLAKHLQAAPADGCRTETGAIVGTPGYMAPEQSAGNSAELGPAVDVYALGAILYEALTGRPPFKGATVLDTLQQACTVDPVPPSRLQPGVPRDLQAVCLKCLEKSPHRRYGSARALAEDLARFLRGEPTRARPLGLLGRSVKWARRRPALAALAVFVVVTASAGTAGIVAHNAELRREVARTAATAAEAQRQRQRAAESYETARAALNRILDKLQSTSARDVPRVKELRRNVLEQMLAFYEASIRDADDLDPAVARDMAVAYHRISQIQWQLGDWDAAKQSARRSLALAQKLIAGNADNPEFQDCLANSYVALTCYSPGANDGLREPEKIDCLQKALAIYQRLLRQQPENPAWNHRVATVYHDLGGVSFGAQRLDEAESLYSKAAAIRRVLAERHPDDPAYQAALAEDELCLGLVESQLHRSGPAENAYDQANRLLRKLIRSSPENADYPLSLSALYINWAFLLAADKHPQSALSLLSEGIGNLRPLLEREPSDQLARERMINLHGARAQIYESQGHYAQAVPDWERLLSLENRTPLIGVRHVELANALAHDGDHARAADEAGRSAARADTEGDVLYSVACIFALCTDAARADSRLSATARAALTERYARRAVATLQKLRAAGYFKERKRLDALREESDLKALHARADFQQFLATLSPV